MFLGDVFDWEQKKLGDVLSSFDYGLNAASKKYDGKNKYLRITDIDDITHKFKYDNLTSPKSNDIISNNFKLNTGDIVFARTGASVGKTYQYDINDGDVYFAGYLIRGKTLPQNNPSFIFDTTLLDKYKNFVRIMSIRSGQPGINAEEYKKYNIFIPKYTEQNKVANLLKKISDFEATQQRKLDQLKLLKKGLLQKMFADEKSKVPEIRFKGFDGEWELEKGKNIFKSRSEKNFPSLPILSATQNRGMIKRNEYNSDIKFDKNSVKNYKRVLPGDFIIHLRSFQGGFAYSDIEGITSPAYKIFYFINSNNFNNYFWREKFMSYDFIQLLKKVTYGVRDGRSINYFDFMNLKELYPSNVEQEKIGKSLNQLNILITKEQHKLNQLQQIKKFLLQNMFI